MIIIYWIISITKIIVFSFFGFINITDEGSPGWAFHHLGFMWIVLLIFLPLSFVEKSILLSKGFTSPLSYIPILIAVLNFIPIWFGNYSTRIYITTQIIGIVATIALLVLIVKRDYE